jgi:hypothetical protein
MGYNAQLVKVSPIPSKKAAAATAILHLITAALDQRITIPFLRLKTGTGGGTLSVLQTEGVYRCTQGATADAIVTVPGIPAGLTGRTIVIRDSSGECKRATVQAQTGEEVTLSVPIPARERCILYLLGTETGSSTAQFPLTPSASTVLEADCPGVIAGKEQGWPLGLFLENTDGNAEIEGGLTAFIGV